MWVPGVIIIIVVTTIIIMVILITIAIIRYPKPSLSVLEKSIFSVDSNEMKYLYNVLQIYMKIKMNLSSFFP